MGQIRARGGIVTFLQSSGAAAPTALQTLLAKFPGGSGGMIAKRVTGGNTFYSLMHDIGNGWVADLSYDSNLTLDGEAPAISRIQWRRMMANVNQDAAGVTLQGTWGTALSNTSAYGGNYQRSLTAGDYAEWTSPAGTTVLRVWSITGGTNAGLALVTIDGSNTLANLLPTAQALVDAGTYANTILVANGGTLNPTDKVLDLYNLPYLPLGITRVGVTVADNLTAGAHTIRVTVTGYKRAAASNVYVHFAGFGYYAASVNHLSSGLYCPVEYSFSPASEFIFAYAFTPQAGGDAEWMGHAGSLDLESGPVITVDGVETAIDEHVFYAGAAVKLAYTVSLQHSTAGQVGAASIAMTAKANCLLVEHSITWGVNGTVTGYPAMFPMLSTIVQRGSNVGSAQDWTLTANDSNPVANAASQAAYMWSQAGAYAGLLYIPDLATTVNNYANTPDRKLFIEDRTGGTLEKIYCQRAVDVSVSADEVWQSAAEYRFGYFLAGAEAYLARA